MTKSLPITQPLVHGKDKEVSLFCRLLGDLRKTSREYRALIRLESKISEVKHLLEDAVCALVPKEEPDWQWNHFTTPRRQPSAEGTAMTQAENDICDRISPQRDGTTMSLRPAALFAEALEYQTRTASLKLPSRSDRSPEAQEARRLSNDIRN